MAEQHLLLAHYRYDPLDRLAGLDTAGQAGDRFFYRRNRLATQIQGSIHKTILYADDQPLAQHQDTAGATSATLLACDQPRSVLRTIGSHALQALTYNAYGHGAVGSGLASLLGFNGERSDPLTGHYLLGNGYRAFNPVLMRFNSPDSSSPFGLGGINTYAYCQGDPVNLVDPLGRAPITEMFKLLDDYARSVQRAPIPQATTRMPSSHPASSASNTLVSAPNSTISQPLRGQSIMSDADHLSENTASLLPSSVTPQPPAVQNFLSPGSYRGGAVEIAQEMNQSVSRREASRAGNRINLRRSRIAFNAPQDILRSRYADIRDHSILVKYHVEQNNMGWAAEYTTRLRASENELFNVSSEEFIAYLVRGIPQGFR